VSQVAGFARCGRGDSELRLERRVSAVGSRGGEAAAGSRRGGGVRQGAGAEGARRRKTKWWWGGGVKKISELSEFPVRCYENIWIISNKC